MCHGFYLEHTRHNGFFGEVSLEERFVYGYVLYTYNVVGANLYHLVYQCKRIAVGEQLTDAVYIHHGCFVAIIYRCLDFVQADFLADGTGKLVVDGVARTGSDDASLDGLANQSQVADDVEQFMTGGLIVPHQRNVVDVAQLGSIHVGNSHDIGQLVVVFLRHLAFINHDGIVQVATLNQTMTQERFNFAYKDKGTCRSNFFGELVHVFQCSELVEENLRIV